MNTMPSTASARIAMLREHLDQRDVDGFIIPISDAHMSEYVGDYAQRLAWLTGFKGSAGSAIVLKEQAAMFIDGRYTTQVRAQVDGDIYDYVAVPDTHPIDWAIEHLPQNENAGEDGGAKLAYDPWLHTRAFVDHAAKKLARIGASLVPAQANPIDELWADQPARPAQPVVDHLLEHAGVSREDKLRDIAAAAGAAGAKACVIASLDGVAWALNMRGRDIANSPVALAFLIVPESGRAVLCMDDAEQRMDDDLKRALSELCEVKPYQAVTDVLADMAADGGAIMLDPATAVAALFNAVEGAGGQVISGREPTTLPKACKNQTEQDGTRAAHVRDGAALSGFLHWFDGTAPQGGLTEMAAADHLATRRARVNLFRDLSFRTISAAGPHAALPHYSVDADSNIEIPTDGLFLVDSGGQYLDGTTDVTRTIQVGEISDEARRRYTQVLKGHIALATVRFPKGTPGGALDTLARMALWADGADYDHGTGHGVGSYLNVHEGPQKIAKAMSGEPLQPGMILSNEPGYYKEGDFGIRIENLVLVTSMGHPGDEREMLGFETLTLAPIDTRPLVLSLLREDERAWLNAYHERVAREIGPRLEGEEASWLARATRAI